MIEIEPNVRLLLVGEGPLKSEIKNSSRDIDDKVLF